MAGGQTLVSTAGGMSPRWRNDGKELYYVAPDGTLMAVSVAVSVAVAGGVPRLGAPTSLFRPNILYGGAPPIGFHGQFDVAADGRFLVNVAVGDAVTPPITVIQNWNPKN